MFKVFFTVLLMGVLAGMVLAQDTDLEPTNVCSESDTQAFLDSLTELIETPPEGDFFHWLDVLESVVTTHRFNCSGMLLFGDKIPGKESFILGTVNIPAGWYRAVVTTESNMFIGLTPLTGDCYLSFGFQEGEASAGTEELFIVEEDCSAIVEVQPNAKWELRLIPIPRDK